MAYAKINQLLEGDDQAAGGGKADIFGGEEQQGLSLTGGDSGGGAPAADSVKTSTEGSVDSGGAQKSQAAQAQTDQAQNFESRDIVNRNLGKQQGPTTLDDVGSRLETAKNTLEDEASNYLSSRGEAREEQYGGDRTETYESAIGGDQEASDYVSGLGTTRTPYGEEDRFNPNTNVQVAPGLGAATRGGQEAGQQSADEVIRGYMQREQGPQYTRSESDLDLALLRQTPDYQQRLRDLGATQRDLSSRYGEIGGETTQSAYDADEAARQAALEGAQGYFGTQASDLFSAQEAEEAAFREALAQQTPESFGGEIRTGLAGEQVDPYLQAQIAAGAGVDPTQYFTAAPQDFGAQEFFDAQEAQRYNRIMELLGGANIPEGRPGQVQAGGLGAGINSEFNSDAYRTALLSGAQGQARTLDDQIAELIRQGTQGYDQFQSGLSDPFMGLGDQVNAAIRDVDSTGGYGTGGIAGFLPENYNLDPSSYITGPDTSGLGYEDFLSPEQLQQLDALAGERMTTHERQGYASSAPGAATFDRDKFYADALARLSAAKDAEAADKLNQDQSINANMPAMPGQILAGENAPSVDPILTPAHDPADTAAGNAAIDDLLSGIPQGSILPADPDSYAKKPRAEEVDQIPGGFY